MEDFGLCGGGMNGERLYNCGASGLYSALPESLELSGSERFEIGGNINDWSQ